MATNCLTGSSRYKKIATVAEMLHCKKANVCTASRGRRDLSKGWAAGTSEALPSCRSAGHDGGVRTRSAIVEIPQSAITGRLPAGRLHDLPDRQTLERGQEWDVPGMLARTGTTPMTREKIAA